MKDEPLTAEMRAYRRREGFLLEDYDDELERMSKRRTTLEIGTCDFSISDAEHGRKC